MCCRQRSTPRRNGVGHSCELRPIGRTLRVRASWYEACSSTGSPRPCDRRPAKTWADAEATSAISRFPPAKLGYADSERYQTWPRQEAMVLTDGHSGSVAAASEVSKTYSFMPGLFAARLCFGRPFAPKHSRAAYTFPGGIRYYGWQRGQYWEGAPSP